MKVLLFSAGWGRGVQINAQGLDLGSIPYYATFPKLHNLSSPVSRLRNGVATILTLYDHCDVYLMLHL